MSRPVQCSYCLRSQSTNSQLGVGLIEVLIALIVLSIGFLVSANMQVRGMRSNQHAFHQSQALLLSGELMDRMRSNREGVAAGHYDNKTTGVLTSPTCVTNGCDAAGIASLDLFEVSASLQSLRGDSRFTPMLPAASDGAPATAAISAPDVDGIYTLTLAWEQSTDGSLKAESLSVRFVP